MSDSVRRFDRRLTWAVLASLALHVWLAAVFPSGIAMGDRPVEMLSFAHVQKIRIVRRPPAPPLRARTSSRARTRVARAPHRLTPPTRHGPRAAAVLGRTVPVAAAAPIVTSPPLAVSKATTPPQIPAVTAAHAVGGYMPFGAEENDPVLDPRVLQALQQLDVHATLTILVGDDGKTKSVAFSPPLDPQIESTIQSVLANANWDPAYCGGGIPCAKSTTIKI